MLIFWNSEAKWMVFKTLKGLNSVRNLASVFISIDKLRKCIKWNQIDTRNYFEKGLENREGKYEMVWSII